MAETQDLDLKIGDIVDANKNRQSPNQHYMPHKDLNDLINEDTVASELELDSTDAKVQYIVKNAKRLFCIMVLLKNLKGSITDAAARLEEYGVTDDFLPVLYDRTPGMERILSLKGAPKDDVGMQWFSQDVQGMTATRYKRWAGEFNEKQWRFLAPVFNNYEAVYPLQDSCPLPFTDYIEDKEAKGATSMLAMAQIHPAHLKAETAGDWVAIKKINETDDKLLQKVVQREVAALDLVRRLKHQHLIKFIASYSHQGRHHLVFEWANGGNLKEFWKNMDHTTPGPKAPSRQETVRWAMQQMTGLAGALDKLHNPGVNGLNCRHGDLKPANVVIATGIEGDPYGLGLLQITDMGLAKVNDQRTRIRKTSGTHSITERYQSPEFRFRISPDAPTSRSYDMWSMGCIMLEFVIWLLYGGRQLDEFNKSFPSAFFDDASQEASIKLDQSVIRWISHMKKTAIGKHLIGTDQCASDALAKVLEIVEYKLLVKDESWRKEMEEEEAFRVRVTRPNDDRQGAPTTERIESRRLLEELEKIQKEGEEKGPTYFFRGATAATTSSFSSSSSSSDFEWPPPPSQETPPSLSSLSLLSPNPTPARGPERTGPIPTSSRSPQGDHLAASTQNEYSVEPMPDYWDTYPDNQLALSVFPDIETAAVVPSNLPNPAPGLCHRCSDIFSSHFVFDTNIQGVADGCGICQILSAHLAASSSKDGNRFVRRGSYLARHSAGPPIYSIIVGPGISAAPNDLQRSFPKLPDPGSDAEFVVLRRWLRDCDDKKMHRCDSAPTPVLAVDELPTRLVAVGKSGDGGVGIIESKDMWEDDSGGGGVRLRGGGPQPTGDNITLRRDHQQPDLRYVALSHRWAYPKGMKSFKLAKPVGTSSTADPYTVLVTKENGKQERAQDTYAKWVTDKHAIPVASLPQNFQDAVTVARALNIPYLWIDSLCIIQGDKDDWEREAGRMRRVYNGAYCTVAATRAALTTEGFLLKPRRQPSPSCAKIRAVTPSGKQADIYLREAIDNFHKDVELAELNQRGWVFQERALSRRILHFAGPQVYMECGGGICCETTTRLFNRASFFFSDANFPSQAHVFYKGMKIRFYETIYTQYAARSFSYASDRAVALDGLESKILDTYETAGRYGILQLPDQNKHIHRSLMWQRADGDDDDNPGSGNGALMYRITGDEDGGGDKEARARMDRVPTWSWMKVMGPIKYFPIDMGTVDWSGEDVLASPFKGKPPGFVRVQRPEELHIAAVASGVDPAAYTATDKKNMFVLDCVHSPAEVEGLMCVVVGKQKKTYSTIQQMHYVLLVAPRRPGDAGCREYERVGVARIEQKYVLAGKGGKITLV
ncbi:hypothetical protein B0T24DRAFT_677879 [Lasiosphaeria ovina]|uniref:Protein kinase domain-containing protein n=1 Tax=Lasiosphaeria ovina TaxID=92902 RepID=A0AAE0NBZ0_9PEZI|nr:hypothetical protein B0T24DRAFT_677879 [Lasiosphaeria ovina]